MAKNFKISSGLVLKSSIWQPGVFSDVSSTRTMKKSQIEANERKRRLHAGFNGEFRLDSRECTIYNVLTQ